MERTLKLLKQGESAIVSKINAKGSLKRRLYDMGITPGITITFKKEAPLGDPIEVNLRGYQLSLRKTEAELILIK